MYLYVVTSFRSYCCGNEEYFGADEIFTSRTAASEYIKKDMEEVLSESQFDNPTITDDSIFDGDRLFRWNIDVIVPNAEVKREVYETKQHEYDIEDIKYTMEIEDDYRADHIQSILTDLIDRIAYLKRDKEDDGMHWLDAAFAAIDETIEQNIQKEAE